ncbi:MAG: T9SS type A sorting domain-containing protein [Bacteroidota bacterium]
MKNIVECVGQTDDGTYFAWLGYENKNSETYEIPYGDSNNLYRVADDPGLPTTFAPGRHRYVARVEYTSGTYTWRLKTPEHRSPKTSSFGTRTWGDCVYDRFADLSLTATVGDPNPEVDERTPIEIVLRNDGSVPATDIKVLDFVPEGVILWGVEMTAGRIDEPYWVVPSLAAGASDTLWVMASLGEEASLEGHLEIMEATGTDPDSSPGNGDPSEDDYAPFSISTLPPSGGGDGGLESDGSLATLLGRRDVNRMIDARRAHRLGLATAPLQRLGVASAQRTRGTDLDLQSLLPTDGPFETQGYVTTPEDLLLITNAKALLAADYLQDDGDRAGVVFAALTPAGETYDHTKAICDRVKGSRLEAIRTVDLAGARFILLRVGRPDGSVDYAVSFVAYPENEGYTVDSRFRAEEYAIAQGEDDDVLNVQVWGSTPDITIGLVDQILDELDVQADVSNRNWAETMPTVPSVFVRGGSYVPGALVLDIANTTGASQTIQLSGTTTDVEEGERDTFERTVTVPAEGLQTEIELTNIFDIGFSVVADEVTDYVYLADGVWTYTSGDSNDKLGYTIEAGGVAPELGIRPVERNARLVGTTETWAALFRSIQPGTRPADMTAYDALAFEASGTGRVQVLLNKTSTNGIEPFHVWIDLAEEAQTFYLPFADFRRGDGSERLTAEDMTLIAFYTYNEGGAPTPFDMDVSNVRFEQSSLVSTEEAAEASLELAIAPNPSRGAARVAFTLPEASDVTVEVVDLLGRRVSVLAERSYPAGSHTLALPETVAAGTYLVRLQAGRDALTRTITRLP